jgi:hypothetical protein
MQHLISRKWILVVAVLTLNATVAAVEPERIGQPYEACVHTHVVEHVHMRVCFLVGPLTICDDEADLYRVWVGGDWNRAE